MEFKFNTFQISKLLFAVYVSYTFVLSWVGYYVPFLKTVLLIGAVLALIFYEKISFKPTWEITVYLIFALYALLSGMLVARDYNVLIDAILTFIEYLASVYLIIRYVMIDKSMNYPMIVFVIQGVLASLLTTFKGVSVGQRATIAENINVNTIGIMVAFSLAYLLYIFISSDKRIFFIILNIFLIILFCFTILQTVSKKSIISALLFILMWVVCCYRAAFKQMNKFVRLFIFACIAFLLYYAFMWYQGKFAENFDFLLYRFDLINDGSSSTLRRLFINDAFKTFFDNLVIGVGLNNYRFHNSIMQTYSHCFYSEICVCTGLIGTFLFIYPIVSSIVYIFKHYIRTRKNDYIKGSQTLFIICIVLVYAFICFTQIIFYEYNLMFFLGILIAYKYHLKYCSK